MKSENLKETDGQNGDSLPQLQKNNTRTEIANNFKLFESFLTNTCGVPEKDIPVVKYIINEKNSPIKDKNCTLIPELYVELKNLNINDEDIYSIIWPELIKNYAWIVDKEGTILSAYLIKSIINRKNTHEISHVSNLMEKSDEKIGLNGLNGLSIGEIKEILGILNNYYYNYIREHDNDEDNWFKDGYKKALKYSERELGSLEAINLENSENQTDFLEQRISYYLQQYSKISSKDSESKDYLTERIFGDGQHETNGLINVKNVKFSRNLFLELLKYPIFYKKLIKNLDKFLLEHSDYKYFFDLIIKRKNVSELKTLESSIDDFKGLEDEDYIELYFSLYPKRKFEALELEPPQFINKYINDQIGLMREEELENFIDLIKTTQYRTSEISNKCYGTLKSKGKYKYLVKNYAMGYFSQIMEDRIFNDISESDKKLQIIREYLPNFFQLEKARNDVNKILAEGNINLSYINRCFELMENRETLKKGLRGRIN